DSGDGGGGDWNKASCDQVGLVPGPLSEIFPSGCKPTSGRPARAQNGAFAPRWATERTTTPGGIIRPHSGNRSDATPGVAAGLCTGSRACTGATAGWPPHAARRREADRKPPELARKPGSSDRKAPEPCTQPPEPCAQGKKPCVQPLAACAQSRKPCARTPPAPAASPGTLRASRRALRAKLPCLARKRQSLARKAKSPARGVRRLARENPPVGAPPLRPATGPDIGRTARRPEMKPAQQATTLPVHRTLRRRPAGARAPKARPGMPIRQFRTVHQGCPNPWSGHPYPRL